MGAEHRTDGGDVGALVRRAVAPDARPDEKQAVFGQLVGRFQDMACACAYGVLGNFWLAEDVAQDAFITAWQKLDQLRDPDAFPGWLKSIVFTHCHRVTRGKRLTLAPLDAGAGVVSTCPDPYSVLAQIEAENDVRALLDTLPEGERIAAILYYMADYSQAEIGACLGLRANTVAKRLFAARRHLKRRAVERFARGLRGARPSRNRSFEDAVLARLRPIVDGDRTEPEAHGLIRRRYVAERPDSTAILGYGAIEQSIYRPRYTLSLVIDPQHLRSGVGDLLFDRLMSDLHAVDAITVSLRVLSSRHELLTFLTERGFEETRRVWHLRLTLSDLDVARLAAAAERASARGVRITTLAAERGRDPACIEKLHHLIAAIDADEPGRRVLPPSFNLKEALIWLEQPYVLPDAYFIATLNDQYIGVCDLNTRGAAAGELVHGFTGVRQEHRRQGVAMALKTAAIGYARQHGYKVVRACNRPAQTAIIALNEALGFRRGVSDVTLERCLKEMAAVDPRVYDVYAGRYHASSPDEPARDLSILVTREDDRLFAEFAGQKVELFPESDSTFFVKYFYGRAEFAGNDRLFWRERQRSNREVTVCATKAG